MIDLGNLSAMELDVLNELGNIGSGHAATSLSILFDKDVDISVPKIRIVEIKNIYNELINGVVAGVLIALESLDEGRSGYLYIMLPENSSKQIVTDLLGMENTDNEMYASTVMEIGNILSSSFCDALAEFMDIVLLPSPPSYAMDSPTAIIDSVVSQMAKSSEHIIIFGTSLRTDSNIEIFLSLLPEQGLLDSIMKTVGQL
ncbi:MAG: chemotaxis protein CheC [Euryarchaeota archaeon]|jgi:chemotaxis protein CheC|nr:chemotaxis protein CheC [Euryarchaeota archaeon]